MRTQDSSPDTDTCPLVTSDEPFPGASNSAQTEMLGVEVDISFKGRQEWSQASSLGPLMLLSAVDSDLSQPSAAGCLWTWTLSPTGNPSCPGQLLVSTAPRDVKMQAVFALGLFSFHGKTKQNKHTGTCTLTHKGR